MLAIDFVCGPELRGQRRPHQLEWLTMATRARCEWRQPANIRRPRFIVNRLSLTLDMMFKCELGVGTLPATTVIHS